MSAKPKHDYNGNEFYDEILALAMSGLNDAEIAERLDLEEETFNRMKNGKVNEWSDEQNKERSERIHQVLTRGRKRIVGALRGTYISTALGKKKLTSRTKKFIEERCECGGLDAHCGICGGTGRVVRSDKWITLETETDTAPNMQAIATLLYHYDKTWRKVERKQDEDAGEVPTNVETGISIEQWITQEMKQADTADE